MTGAAEATAILQQALDKLRELPLKQLKAILDKNQNYPPADGSFTTDSWTNAKQALKQLQLAAWCVNRALNILGET